MIRAMDRHRADKHHAGMEHLLQDNFFDFTGLCKEKLGSIQDSIRKTCDDCVQCYTEVSPRIKLEFPS